jgi:hypothetical protein
MLQLQYTGSAIKGNHFETLPRYISFAVGQQKKLLYLTPKSDTVIPAGGLNLKVSGLPDDDTSQVAGDAVAEVFICRDRTDAEALQKVLVSRQKDPDGDGIVDEDETALGSDPEVVTMILKQGWNLVSVPTAIDKETTLSDQLGMQPNEAGISVWAWEKSCYKEQTEPLHPGVGYFVFALEDYVIDISGELKEGTVKPGNKGWNLLGPYQRYSPLEIPDHWIGFTFVDGEYRSLSDSGLVRSQGFWLFKKE